MARRPGEFVKRVPGSCFVGSADPKYLQLTTEADGDLHYRDPYCCLCHRRRCGEWASAWVVDENGVRDGRMVYHVHECKLRRDAVTRRLNRSESR